MRISSHSNFFCQCNKGMSLESAANLARRFYRSNPTVTWQNSTTYPYHIFFLSANLGPALCKSCVMLILSYLQAAPTCAPFCISANPPDSSRGSASEDQGLALMWQKQHPSLPWCLSPATRSLRPSGRAVKVNV